MEHPWPGKARKSRQRLPSLSKYNMRGGCQEVLVDGGTVRRVGRKEGYEEVMNRFRGLEVSRSGCK